MVDIIKTLDDAVPFLSAYNTWVKVLVGTSIVIIPILLSASVLVLLFSSKAVPVERWLLPSEDANIKALVPGDMFQDWQIKKQTEDDLTRQLNDLSAQQLGVGASPPSPSADLSSLRLKVQRAQNERGAAEDRIVQYLSRELLATGKLVARGIPNEAPPHDNEQITIKPAQWQYLLLTLSQPARALYSGRQAGDAVDYKGTTVFKGVEIGRPKGHE
jgi:hypothetical protein